MQCSVCALFCNTLRNAVCYKAAPPLPSCATRESSVDIDVWWQSGPTRAAPQLRSAHHR